MIMKKFSKLQILGLILIICSLVLLVGSRVYEARAKQTAAAVVEKMEALLPEKSEGSMESFTNMSMPLLQIDGLNFSGLLEVPAFGVTLPIYDAWEASRTWSFPCRFSGSVYDGSLVVGGSDQAGQFDFCSKLDLGAYIRVTDMTGAQYEYEVTRIVRSKHAGSEKLDGDEPGLTLFVRDRYSMQYIIVRCSAEGTCK